MLLQGENVSTCVTGSSLAPTEPFSPYVKDTEAAPGLGTRGRQEDLSGIQRHPFISLDLS